MDKKGTLFVVSAPSGAGKTTLVTRVLNRFPRLSYSVSHTTRQPRTGEVHGKDYFFVTPDEFRGMVDRGMMLEWAKVHDNYYGTSRAFVEKTLEKGDSLIMDIDVQGAYQIMDADLKSVSIFIMPPSMEVLEQRLKNRRTEPKDVIAMRLENARKEIAQKDRYTHVIVNDQLDRAVEEICAIFERNI